MALALAGLETMTLLPALGAAVFLPSAMATALRLEEADQRDVPGTVRPSVDALLQRFDSDLSDLSLGGDLELDLQFGERDTTLLESMTTRSPYDTDSGVGVRPGLDTWSVVWYCGMFAAFTSLFLIMPCSQVLCRAGLLHGHSDPRLRPRAPLGAFQSAAQGYATPPPPYKQFAPPAYEDLILDLDFAPPGKAVPVSALPPSPLSLPPPPPPEKDKEGMDGVYVIPLRPESGVPSTQAAA